MSAMNRRIAALEKRHPVKAKPWRRVIIRAGEPMPRCEEGENLIVRVLVTPQSRTAQ